MPTCCTRQIKSWQIFCSVPQHLPMNFALMPSSSGTPKKSKLSSAWGQFATEELGMFQVLVNSCIRRILKIFWPVQISNQELWARAKQSPTELEIRQRKWGWLGHTLRRQPGDIAKAVLGWNPQGTGPRTTWRRTILEEIRRQGKTWKEAKILAKNRVRWRNLVRAPSSLE